MPFSEIALIARWIVPLWALGWLLLPLVARLFWFLPDQGLAVGRVVALVAVGLVSFWGAAAHLIPLGFAPGWFALLLLAALGWRSGALRAQIARHRRALLWSDAVFLLGFALFLWVRLRHPEANDLEKPMDMALLAAARRAEFLPFPNPWLAGTPFTNYYYFGPLLGALLAKTLATPPFQAYNLVQPLFCALFLSTLWSLGAALSGSARWGLSAMWLVGLGGNFEPLRQISQTHQLWPLDWWKTSRVIENTINEYPAFTLLVGDLHAHFYALALAVTHFCVCLGLLQSRSPRGRSALLLLGGAMLGAFALTNTWDVPLYGLLLLGCALQSLPSRQRDDQLLALCTVILPFSLLALFKVTLSRFSVGISLLWLGFVFLALLAELVAWISCWKAFQKVSLTRKKSILWTAAPFFLAAIIALPYFWRFKPQVSGVTLDVWAPNAFSFALLWGGWWMIGFGALLLPPGEAKSPGAATMRRLLVGIGLVALFFPFLFTIGGYFGGDLRHQDTVFKFGLQAWLLLGLGIAGEAGFRLKSWWRTAAPSHRFAALPVGAVLLAISSLAPLTVAWTRVLRDAPRDASGNFLLSLNAARFLPPDELDGIEWLRQHARAGESVVEAPSSDGRGGPGGDYDPNCGRVGAFSGVPSVLGWPQHVWMWGADWGDINRRYALTRAIYGGPNPYRELQKAGATYVFLGAREWAQAGGKAPRIGQDLRLERVRGWNGSSQAAPQIVHLK